MTILVSDNHRLRRNEGACYCQNKALQLGLMSTITIWNRYCWDAPPSSTGDFALRFTVSGESEGWEEETARNMIRDVLTCETIGVDVDDLKRILGGRESRLVVLDFVSSIDREALKLLVKKTTGVVFGLYGDDSLGIRELTSMYEELAKLCDSETSPIVGVPVQPSVYYTKGRRLIALV